jgi:membrane protease YdiL (CAAX protease family)
MASPDSLHLLLPIVMMMGLLLTGGVASLIYFLTRPPEADAPWRVQLAASAQTSPWQWIDILHILMLLLMGQLLLAWLPETMGWKVFAFHGVLGIGIFWRARGKKHPFGIRPPFRSLASQAVLRWLAVLPLLWFSAFLWQLLLKGIGYAPDLQEAIQLFMDSDSLPKRAAFIFFAVVIAPLLEEGLFRGILQPLFIRRFGAVAGVVLVALGFAALHMDVGTFVTLALISIALSFAYARTGSLWVPVLMHALFNAVNLTLLMLLIRAGDVQ